MTSPQSRATAGSEREALLPCPFCDYALMTELNEQSRYYIYCASCDTDGPKEKTPEQAIAAWNRRASQPSGAAGGEVDDDAENEWRRLALQFDGHRMMAMGLLKFARATLRGGNKAARDNLLADIDAFIVAPPLAGEVILAERLASLASPSSGGWQWVPVDPTPEMIEAAMQVKRERLMHALTEMRAGKNEVEARTPVIKGEWEAMLAAAPQSSGDSHE